MGPMGLIGHIGLMGLIGLIELIDLSYKRNNNKEMFLLSFCCYCVVFFIWLFCEGLEGFILIIIYRI